MSYFEELLEKLKTATKTATKTTNTKKRKDEDEGFLEKTIGMLQSFANEKRTAQEDDIAPTKAGGGGRSFDIDELKSSINEATASYRKRKAEEEKVVSTTKSSSNRSSGGSSGGRSFGKEEDDAWYKGWLTSGGFRRVNNHFKDGYQFGDVGKSVLDVGTATVKTIIGTGDDLARDATAGALGIGEKAIDAVAYGAGKIGGLFGATSFTEDVADFIKKDLYDEEAVSKKLNLSPAEIILRLIGVDDSDDVSVLGDKTDSLAQSGGQLAGQIALQSVGVPWWLTSGVTSFGSESENALKQGASYDEAGLSAAITAGAEILTEKLFGGSGLGEKGLINVDKLTKGITNKVYKALADYGIDVFGEGLEEVGSEFISRLGQVLTHEREATWKEILTNEEAMDDYIHQVADKLFGIEARQSYIESGIGGSILGGTMNVGNVTNSVKTGKDYRTGLNADDQTVFDKILEEKIADAEKDGKKLTAKEKDELYDSVMEDLENGSIDVDDIERILGGDSYNAHQSEKDIFLNSEAFKTYHNAIMEAKKLEEEGKNLDAEEKSLAEELEALKEVKVNDANLGQQARFTEIPNRQSQIQSRRSEIQNRLKELTTKSDEMKAQLMPNANRINGLKSTMRSEMVERLKDSKLAESYRELARSTEKFTADVSKYKGENAKKTIQNIIDSGLTDNSNKMHRFVDFLAKISEDRGVTFSLTDAKKLAGTVHDFKGAIANAFVKGNEITLNTDSKKMVETTVGHEITHVLEGTEFYETLSKAVQRWAVEKGEWNSRLASVTELYKKYDPEADPVKEVVADLVGEYLFTDSKFINNLSTQNRNVFQKVYDEIKYLCKIATAGSQEARDLERVRRVFEKAWRSSGKTDGKTETKNSLSETEKVLDKSVFGDENSLTKNQESGETFDNGRVREVSADSAGEQNAGLENAWTVGGRNTGSSEEVNTDGRGHSENGGSAQTNQEWRSLDSSVRKKVKRIVNSRINDPLNSDDIYAYLVAGTGKNESEMTIESYNEAVDKLSEEVYNSAMNDHPAVFEITWKFMGENTTKLRNAILKATQANKKASSKDGVFFDGKTPKYSLSDSNGKQLSDAQAEFFKDSVVRDENGNLKVMYHGTSKGGHTVFDTYGGNHGLFGVGSYFTDSKTIGESYTYKGDGTNPQVYENYLNIQNPMDMDAQANPAEWAKAFPDASFPVSGTNEDFYRAMEEYFYDEMYHKWEAADAAREAIEGMGYDGITHMGGGRVNPNGERHQVYIAFHPEQIKNTDNANPTEDPDIRYSISENKEDTDRAYLDAVLRGDIGTARKMVDDVASEYINSLLLPNDGDEAGFKYHRGKTPTKTFKRYAVFNVSEDGFRAAYAGNKNATPVGVWLDAQNLQSYMSDMIQFDDGSFASYIPGDTGAPTKTKFTPEKMEEYGLTGGQRWLMERGGKHSSDVPNFSQMNLRQNERGEKVASAKDGALPHNKLVFEIEYGISDDGDLTDYVRENGRMMKGKNQGLAKIEPNQYYDFKTNPNAVGNWGIGGTFRITRIVPHEEIVSVTNQYKADAIADAQRLFAEGEISKKDMEARIKSANAIQVQKWVGGYNPAEFGITDASMQELVAKGRKMKLTDAVTYDDKGNVIPLSERFNAEKDDIRYSISEDSDGNKLTDAQKEFFNDTKAVDENGNLLKVYHTTKNDFTVFDDARKGEATEANNTYMGHFFTNDPDYMNEFPEFDGGKTDAYYLNMKNPIDMNNISRQAFLDIVEVTGGDVTEAAEIYDREYEAEVQRANFRGDNRVFPDFYNLIEELTGEFYDDAEFHKVLQPNYDKLLAKGYDGFINNMDGAGWANEYIVIRSNQAKLTTNTNPTTDSDIRYSLTPQEVQETNDVLKDVGVELDGNSGTVSYSLSSLKDAFGIEADAKKFLDENNSGADYLRARGEYVEALQKATGRTKEECDRYLDSLFLVGEMIANDQDRLDYEAAVNKSAWVSNAEYGGSIDFSTLCAKRRLFTGTFDAIQEALPDTVLNENDFLRIRNMLLAKELESPCSMCYVEGSRAKHGEYVAKFLKDYLATNPEWKPQIADFTSTNRLEQTRLNHPEAYKAYQDAMNKLAQRKPKEASVRTDYKGEILVAFEDGTSVAIKNENGGIRFNSFSDFEVIHALDCMQVLTDMARVGLNGQAYTKVAAFAEAFGNTGLKINLSLVAKDVDANGKLIYDEVNGMKKDEAMDIRNRYSENVGTVIVVFNEAQLKAALADGNIDYVLPFHRSQWKKSQYTMMGLPVKTRDFTNLQNDRVKNPATGRPVKLSKIKHIANYVNDLTGKSYEVGDNIMPNQYWDYTKSGRENAQRYLDYINSNNLIPKFNFLLDNVGGKWTLPADAVGDGYYKLLIDFKMYNNDGVGSPQNPVLPEFNMPYITKMLEDYKGGHKSFPVAHDVVNEFVNGKKRGKFSLSADGEAQSGGRGTYWNDVRLRNPSEFEFNPFEDIAPVTGATEATPVAQTPVQQEEEFAPTAAAEVAQNISSITDADAPPAMEAPMMSYDDGYMDALVASEPPPVQFDAPVMTQPVTQPKAPVQSDIAPTQEYEAIRPQPQKQPNLVRADAPVAEQHTAQILTEVKATPKKKFSPIHKAVELLVDKGAVFERLSKKNKNRELEAKYNYLHYSNGNAQDFIGNGDPEKGVRSLKSIMEQVGERSEDFFSYLYHIHNADRMTLEQRGFGENKAVFGSNVSADMSNAIWQEIERANPDFRQLATQVYGINYHLRQMMVDGGLISQDTADLWSQMYPHYVPISRADYEAMSVNVPLDTNKTGVNAPVKRAIGGNSDISPLFNTMAKRILQTYRAVDRNSFGVELMNTLGSEKQNTATDFDAVLDGIDAHEELLQKGKNGNAPTFTVFVNGEKVTFDITDEMYDAMKPTSDALAYTNKALNTVSNIRRGLITEYNPVFLATNAIKDAQDVLVNSQHPVKTYANFPRAWAQMIGNGKWFKEYMTHGGGQNTYFEKDTNTFTKEKSTIRKIVGFPLDAIGYANNFVERVPRLAEYIASRESGRSIQTSMLDSARVTTNFAAGGDVTKLLNRNGFTFLNASVQGAAQQVRNVQEARAEGFKGWVKLAGKTVMAGLPAMLLNHLLWEDDEEYEELSDYVKENYYIVGKFGDGQFVRIPKGRTVAVIQEAFQQMSDVMTGDDNADFGKFFNLVMSNLAPNDPFNNFVASPIIQATTNKAWHGGDIVPQSLQDVPVEEQYDESTDMLSRWLGERFGISPMKANYVLDQYSGGIGDTFLPMMTPEAERGNDSIAGQLISPWVDKFTTDSVLNNQNVSDFYDLKDKLTINANSGKATDDDMLYSKYMNSVNSELSDLYKEKREIQNSRKYSDSEKFEMVRDIQEQINERMKDAMSTYEDVTYETDAKTGEKYAVIGDKYFKLTDEDHTYEWSILSKEQTEKYRITSAAGDANYATDGETHYVWSVPDEDDLDGKPQWRKLTDKQLAKQKDVTSKLGITPEEYWADRDEDTVKMYDWVYENPEKYEVSRAVTKNFKDYWRYKSDLDSLDAKDANGKTVSGLKKERVINYINQMDADYGEKIILFRSYYPKDDTYCKDIVEYLNNRSDISYFQMVAILKELDMKVHADGTVTWD